MTDLEWAKAVIWMLMVLFVAGVIVAYAIGREHGKAYREKENHGQRTYHDHR